MASGTITAGKDIRFLLGTQSNLEGYISGSKTAQEGTFYLTQDTHRLYVGTNENKVVPVNEGVITVSEVAALPTTNIHAGEFYYATKENILCVYAGPYNATNKTGGWVQINSNTDTFIITNELTLTAANNVATMSQKFKQNNGTYPTGIQASWQLAGTAGVKVTASDNKITLEGVMNESFTVTAASNVATITLKDSFDHEESFKIKSGKTTTLTVDKDGDDTVKLTVKDMSNTGIAVAVDDRNSNVGFKVSVTDAMGTKSTAAGEFDPKIQIGDNLPAISFVNGVAQLPVYTKEEVDQIHIALNAMTYRGLVGAEKDSSKSIEAWSTIVSSSNANVQIGDTYLFATPVDVTVGNQTRRLTAGSLAIARGTENPATGKIPAGQVIWDYVESTTDTDTKYRIDHATGTNNGYVQLVGTLGGTTESGKKITFKGGTQMQAVVTESSDKKEAIVTVNHTNVTCTPDDDAENNQTQGAATFGSNVAKRDTNIDVLESITVNSQGHVTGYKTKTVTLTDTNATIREVKLTPAVTDNKVTLTSSVQLTSGANVAMTAKTGTLSMNSSTLKFGVTNGALDIDLVWGSFS